MIGLSLIVIAFVFGVVGGVVGFFITTKQHHYLTYVDILKINDEHWDTLKQYTDIRCDFSKYDKWIESIHNSAAHSLDCIVEERQRDRELENYITLVDDRVKAHVRWSLGVWNEDRKSTRLNSSHVF